MEDHIKKTEVQADAPVTMSREDGRLISRMIEDHWSESHARYQPGWSDAKLAADIGKPQAWVKEIRERDFGGVGEDPGVIEFIAQQVEVAGELDGLRKSLDELAMSTADLSAMHTRTTSMFEKYRDRHNVLSEKVKRLGEVAKALDPFAERKAG